MNVLLFAPGLLVLLLLRRGAVGTTFYVALCATVQVNDEPVLRYDTIQYEIVRGYWIK